MNTNRPPVRLATVLAAALAFGLGACSTIQRDDPRKVENVNIDFGSTDLQEMADKMVQSFLSSPNLQYLDHPGKGEDKRVVLYTGNVNNRTSEHIDTASITDSIRTALLKSGRVRIAASSQGQDELGSQVRFQMESGRVDPNLIREFGKQIGADAVMYGNLRSIEKERERSMETAGRRTDDVYYKFTLEVVNVETAEVVWMEEKEIRKTKKTGLFGS
jgi:penicillin-binding protein activator